MDMNPNTGVLVLVPDDVCGSGLWEELDAVVLCRWHLEHRSNRSEYRPGGVGEIEGSEVYVLGWATCLEGGKENTALENKLVAQVAGSELRQESFEDIQLQKFLGCTASQFCLAFEVEVRVAGRRSARDAAQRSISIVWRKRVSARGKALAIRSSSEGWPPCRSQRLSASLARSAPSRWRSRKASMMLRSAE
ncbi:MAG: hypothetical protein QOI10_3611 [Solirubrobacterales bacterium]|nr:hypothetical protein [Solirubrobacterales bacterium]